MRTGLPSWRTLKIMALGAVSFWLPDVVWHAIRRSDFGRFDVLFITLLMPLTLLGTYGFLERRTTYDKEYAVGLALMLMLGVWTLGGFFMEVGATFSGGGFAGPEGVQSGAIISVLGILPPFTYFIATYDGSLAALALATLAAVVWTVRKNYGRR